MNNVTCWVRLSDLVLQLPIINGTGWHWGFLLRHCQQSTWSSMEESNPQHIHLRTQDQRGLVDYCTTAKNLLNVTSKSMLYRPLASGEIEAVISVMYVVDRRLDIYCRLDLC